MKLAIKRGNKGTPKRPELAACGSLIFLIRNYLRVNELVRLKVRYVKDKTIFDIHEGKRTWGFGKNKVEFTDVTEKHLENSMNFSLSSIQKLKGKHADKAKKRKDSSSIAEANHIWRLPDKEFLCEFTKFSLLAKEHTKRQINSDSTSNKWESIDKGEF